MFLPLSLRRSVRGLRWFWKALPAPRPLYGLDHLAARPEAPVLICEGEKAADAAQKIFPGHVVVTSRRRRGGAQSRLGNLKGREVLIWPDYDQSGADYAREVAEILSDMGCVVSVIDVSQLVDIDGGKRAAERTVDGWDAVDAITEWSDLGALRDAALGLERPFCRRREALSHDARPGSGSTMDVPNAPSRACETSSRSPVGYTIAGRRSASFVIRRWAASLRTS